jgi:hypothetical protein
MKKFLILLFFGIILLLALIYLLIPSKVQVSETNFVKSNMQQAFADLSDTSSWDEWWPKKEGLIQKNKSGDQFFYREFSFELGGKANDGIKINIKSDLSDQISIIELRMVSMDSVKITWVCNNLTSVDPVKRFLKYRQSLSLKKSKKDLLADFAGFIDKK